MTFGHCLAFVHTSFALSAAFSVLRTTPLLALGRLKRSGILWTSFTIVNRELFSWCNVPTGKKRNVWHNRINAAQNHSQVGLAAVIDEPCAASTVGGINTCDMGHAGCFPNTGKAG